MPVAQWADKISNNFQWVVTKINTHWNWLKMHPKQENGYVWKIFI